MENFSSKKIHLCSLNKETLYSCLCGDGDLPSKEENDLTLKIEKLHLSIAEFFSFLAYCVTKMSSQLSLASSLGGIIPEQFCIKPQSVKEG